MSATGSSKQAPRLLLVSTGFPPSTGGIERVAGALASGLEGFEIDVVAGQPRAPGGMSAVSAATVHWAANEPPGGRRATIALNRLALRVAIARKPDFAIAMHTRAMPAARAATRRASARSLLVIHAKELREQPQLANAALRWADAVVAASSFSRELALEAGGDGAKLEVIHPGVTVSEPGPLLGERPGPPTVVTVARIADAHKGHDVAIAAMRIIHAARPDVRWVMVGDGTLRSRLQRHAEATGLGDAIVWTGAVSDPVLAEILDAAHVFCLLSRPVRQRRAGEGFGMAFIEAGAHGLPVVGGLTPGVTDAVTDGENGLLVDATDPQQVAAAILRVVGDQSLATRLSQGGRARAEQLAWPRVIGQYERVIERVRSEQRRSQRARNPLWLRDLSTGPLSA